MADTQKLGMKNNQIKEVCYIGKTQELYIKFWENVYPSYDTVCFVNVPLGTVQRFKAAQESKDEFFQKEIRTKYRHYATYFEFALVKNPPPPDENTPQHIKDAYAEWLKNADLSNAAE